MFKDAADTSALTCVSCPYLSMDGLKGPIAESESDEELAHVLQCCYEPWAQTLAELNRQAHFPACRWHPGRNGSAGLHRVK